MQPATYQVLYTLSTSAGAGEYACVPFNRDELPALPGWFLSPQEIVSMGGWDFFCFIYNVASPLCFVIFNF